VWSLPADVRLPLRGTLIGLHVPIQESFAVESRKPIHVAVQLMDMN
jgi:hypothetical protein